MDEADVHDDIEARWSSIERAREDLRLDAESKVVDRAWSTILSSWERPEPLYARRSRLPQARLTRNPPATLNGVKEYGFDAEGRVVLAREYGVRGEIIDGNFVLREPEVPFDLDNDEYFVYLGQRGAESYRFSSRWLVEGRDFKRRWEVQLAQVNRAWRDSEGRLVRYDSYRGPKQAMWESQRYEYRADGQLEHVYLATWTSGSGEAPPSWELFESCTYDAAGALTMIKWVPEGGEVLWRRPPKSLKAAERAVEDALFRELETWAHDHWPDEPVFSLGLGTTSAFPYDVAPGFLTVAERDALLAEPDEYGIGLDLWNPANHSGFDPDFELGGPPEATEALGLLRQEADLTDDEKSPIKLLGRVAKRLADVDWKDRPRDADFVVYAINMEIETQRQITSALRHSVPREVINRFKRAGWLHVAD